jgi:hypothetical protein
MLHAGFVIGRNFPLSSSRKAPSSFLINVHQAVLAKGMSVNRLWRNGNCKQAKSQKAIEKAAIRATLG